MTDQELVELFWQRREEALTGLQDKYGGWCRSIAGRILGEEWDVEECARTSCAAAAESAGSASHRNRRRSTWMPSPCGRRCGRCRKSCAP